MAHRDCQSNAKRGEAISRPADEALDDLVARIVQLAHPLRVILFGSAARGELRNDSDLDVLIVMANGCNCRHLAQFLYTQLHGVGRAKDLVVVQEQDVVNYAGNPNLILHRALKDGKELYRAAS